VVIPPVEDGPDGDTRETDEVAHLVRRAGLVGAGKQPDGVPPDFLDGVPAGSVFGPNVVLRPVADERQRWPRHRILSRDKALRE
jgi:hypothetical protein